jgi:hypothetical protein
MRRFAFLVLLGSFLVNSAWAQTSSLARVFDGSTQALQSSASVTNTGTQLSFSFWLYENSFNNSDELLAESSANYNSNNGAFLIDPNSGSFAGLFEVDVHVAAGTISYTFARPSAAAWHHYVIVWDISVPSLVVYVDGSSVTVTNHVSHTGTFTSQVVNLMSRNAASLWNAGRLAEFAMWNTALTSGNAASLWNSGSGALANTVASGNLITYVDVCGNASPEPDVVAAWHWNLQGYPIQIAGPGLLNCSAPGGGIGNQSGFTYIPVVQSVQGAITNACTFASNVTSGNLVIVASVWKSSTSTPSVSDTRSSTWTQNFIDTGPTVKVAIYSTTLGSGGADTVTFNVTSATAQNVECVELEPKWTLTVDASADSTWSGTPGTLTSPTLTTTLNDDLYVSILSGNGNGGSYAIETASQALGFDPDSSTAFGIKLARAAGSYTTVYTASANAATGTIAAVAYKSLSGITMRSPTALPDAGLNKAYGYCLQATGGNASYTWSITSGSLQTGLSLNTSTGCITGTPTAGPTNTLTFHVTDGTNTADLTGATLKVAASLNTPTIVQAKAASSGTVVFSSNVTSGDMILVSRSDWAGNVLTSQGALGVCSDSLGTIFKILIANHPSNGQQLSSVYYAGMATSTGADTVDCHVSSNSDVWSAEEISNVGNFGNLNSSITVSPTTSPITSSSFTTQSYGMLLVANGIGYTTTATLAIQSPFTAFTSNGNPNEGYEVVTSATSYTATFTETSNTDGHWGISLLAIWPTGGTAAPASSPARHRIIDD